MAITMLIFLVYTDYVSHEIIFLQQKGYDLSIYVAV